MCYSSDVESANKGARWTRQTTATMVGIAIVGMCGGLLVKGMFRRDLVLDSLLVQINALEVAQSALKVQIENLNIDLTEQIGTVYMLLG